MDYSNTYTYAQTGAPPDPLLSVLMLIIVLAIYVYASYALYVIAKKTATANPWLAWIPVANVFLMLKIAGKAYWWFLLLLIPLVNIVVGIYIWMRVAAARSHPSWVGLLMILPFVNLIVLGYIAFADNKALPQVIFPNLPYSPPPAV